MIHSEDGATPPLPLPPALRYLWSHLGVNRASATPVRQRVIYKTAILTRKAHTTGIPSYLKEHLVQHVASRPTRSTVLPLLTVPRLTTDFARRSFSYSAPDIWNSLPANVLLCDCESGFKRHLKTFLFNTCFYSA